MGADEEKLVNGGADLSSDGSEGDPDSALFYVHEETLVKVTKLLEEKKDLTEEMVKRMLDPEGLKDEENLLAVDMTEANAYEDGEAMLKEIGPNRAGKVFVDGRKKFLEWLEVLKKEMGEDPEEFPASLTVKQYKEQLAMEEGEEEDQLDESGEEAEEDVEEPAAKKPKMK
eukprot:TRINITY_DN3669_c0_g1_i2.p1 TRINITY_DN3669_c0_g1~~TRINITY_DN3669_c0_g1_i2.p1  ORF type:complete len:171 (-),score=62.34 TRINITY_DN3669_c0_g1_i2:98-610(-)